MAHSDHGEYREELHGEHPHSYDHTEPKYLLIAVLGGLTVIGIVVSAIAIQFYYERVFESQTYEKVLSQENWQLQDLRRKEAAELQSYGYIDKTKGTVRIPLNEAMRLVTQESAENRLKYPTNPYPVKTPEQLAAAATPAVSQPGAAAATATQNQGVTSSPHVQQSTVPQQPNK